VEGYSKQMDSTKTRSQLRRDAQSAGTRAEIVDAAAALMLERGYVGTSIAAIAERAGVAVQTIYNAVGSKADVLAAVLAVAQDRSGRSGRSGPDLVARLTAAATAGVALGMLADWIVEGNQRAAPMQRMLTEAAGIDPEIRELELSSAARGLVAYGDVVVALRARLGLRPGLSDHEAAASIWALGHPHVFQTLVVDLGWSTETYTAWLRSALPAVLPAGRFPAH
jgi:AcrR family transcriptional regulator